MAELMKTLFLKIRIDPKLRAAFQDWCRANNTTMSERVRHYIERDLKGDDDA